MLIRFLMVASAITTSFVGAASTAGTKPLFPQYNDTDAGTKDKTKDGYGYYPANTLDDAFGIVCDRADELASAVTKWCGSGKSLDEVQPQWMALEDALGKTLATARALNSTTKSLPKEDADRQYAEDRHQLKRAAHALRRGLVVLHNLQEKYEIDVAAISDIVAFLAREETLWQQIHDALSFYVRERDRAEYENIFAVIAACVQDVALDLQSKLRCAVDKAKLASNGRSVGYDAYGGGSGSGYGSGSGSGSSSGAGSESEAGSATKSNYGTAPTPTPSAAPGFGELPAGYGNDTEKAKTKSPSSTKPYNASHADVKPTHTPTGTAAAGAKPDCDEFGNPLNHTVTHAAPSASPTPKVWRSRTRA